MCKESFLFAVQLLYDTLLPLLKEKGFGGERYCNYALYTSLISCNYFYIDRNVEHVWQFYGLMEKQLKQLTVA